ncbi:hypothetical protein CXG81DRAFT_13259 [Caulochytrium protostelioides]|uniref:Acetyl-CoA synthetase-like protein n=1 Tax=Caulochytrium protostelioides TaxID=1555241 RepID=A0A4P9WW52_9FUNG|nr:acetyl-CoA synthetase-like protein [Caulochytrium protostelioides]RKP00408.1 hypothetical protein CXG81DRAFT_13259 [Caulochytrium protostelioides]|eukprot:RKP00408.1 hypothetical protein CXG81DRAFT_13259 [Caulochytrium protostelioides]
MGPPRSKEVTPPSGNCGAIRRNIRHPNALIARPSADVGTLYDILQFSVRTMANKRGFGARPVIKIHEETKDVKKVVDGVETTEKKTWKFWELGPYAWWSYKEFSDRAHQVGAGLLQLGVAPRTKITLFATTSRNWMLMSHGAFSQAITITTAYDTLGESGLSFSLNQCEITTVYTNADLLHLFPTVVNNVKTLANIIYDGDADPAILDRIKAQHAHVRLIHLDELIALGVAHPAKPTPPTPDDVACIMYTSGSTGTPKGVVLRHRNIVAGCGGAETLVSPVYTPDVVLIAYLPLAHILEFMVEQFAIFQGIPLGYGSVRTLTDTSVRNCKGDMRELAPTWMTGVPAVWDSIRKGVIAKVSQQSPLKQKLFWGAVHLKQLLVEWHLPSQWLNKTVFAPIAAQTGGRLSFALSGGAPLARESHRFLQAVLCPIVQGYGMTETNGIIAVQEPIGTIAAGSVGPPVGCVEIKLMDVADTQYKTTNSPNPQGEVLVRGPHLMDSYYLQPELTRETMTEDGWLMTGDIGEWQPDGQLSIIDRKKNLVKLSNGEYVALEKLESVFKGSHYALHVCVYGDSEEAFLVMIMMTSPQLLHKLGEEHGVNPEDGKALCTHPKIVSTVLAEVRQVAKKADLKPAEIPQKLILTIDEWNIENGMLTATQKIKRRDVVEHYQAEINKAYGKKKQ